MVHVLAAPGFVWKVSKLLFRRQGFIFKASQPLLFQEVLVATLVSRVLFIDFQVCLQRVPR